MATAWLAVPDPAAAVQLYCAARERLGDVLVACELMNPVSVDLAVRHIPGVRRPLDAPGTWSLLLELAVSESGGEADRQLEAFLERQIEDGALSDGVLARSSADRDDFWRARHSISEAQKLAGAGIKHDISVPISAVPEFLDAALPLVEALAPGSLPVVFGHLGDGNLHFNLNPPPEAVGEALVERWEEISVAGP